MVSFLPTKLASWGGRPHCGAVWKHCFMIANLQRHYLKCSHSSNIKKPIFYHIFTFTLSDHVTFIIWGKLLFASAGIIYNPQSNHNLMVVEAWKDMPLTTSVLCFQLYKSTKWVTATRPQTYRRLNVCQNRFLRCTIRLWVCLFHSRRRWASEIF